MFSLDLFSTLLAELRIDFLFALETFLFFTIRLFLYNFPNSWVFQGFSVSKNLVFSAIFLLVFNTA